MIKYYYIADTHFSHENVLRHDNRPFKTIEEMNATLIHNWNETVSNDDIVYCLGDMFWENEAQNFEFLKILNGQKILIKGNHDRVKGKFVAAYQDIQDYAEIIDDGRRVVLCHYSMSFYKNQHYKAIMLYGHLHATREWVMIEEPKRKQWDKEIPYQLINVGCIMSYMDYKPRKIVELLDTNQAPDLMKKRRKTSVE